MEKTLSVVEDVNKIESLCIAGENLKYHSRCGKWFDCFSKDSKELKTRTWMDTCTEMSLTALFTIAKI